MKRVLLDCDPGIDDALALALIAGSRDALDLVGVTTVGGNVDLSLTTANALALREFLDLGDVPVTPGSPGATPRRTVRAAVHGTSGLGDAVLPAPVRGPSPGHAAGFIVDALRSAPGEITLVCVGPLTNLALAVRAEPRIVEWARDLVVMGGSYTGGDRVPAAEFNVLTDPEAAATVFAAGWTVTAVGLDVTLSAVVNTAVLDRMRPLGRLAELLVPGVRSYKEVTDDDGPAIHDACAVAYVLDPSLFTCVPAAVTVETTGLHTRGTTVTDLDPAGRRANALVATALDVPGFWDLVLAAYGRLAARLG
ncbi:Pyrimidine-specific ribonucleoside hydrolase RihB [Nonomuraea coxensis DSM 45129]|uniref:Pyrimidine-specific ribonucleoside hydrolase RihB n=1 Tax=Nonomuraea coxensis DSM 45129 TaxID=1122611 RepID=A0ABX8U9N8_9ACTN|nr:nucleoside hydrolase [Nonomuraea coxensis]QYC44492.1 Pyrimidine-specific ribonucleoside hydrolase RihB [Nonomuraea coxensis DSM 45129]